MRKVKTFVPMLCLVLFGALCYASGVVGTGNTRVKGIPIEIKDSTVSLSGSDKSSSIQASIDGHTLSVVFLENLGQVYILVKYPRVSTTTPSAVGAMFLTES